MVVLFFGWLFSGGAEDSRSWSGVLLNPPPPLSDGATHGSFGDIGPEIKSAFAGALKGSAKLESIPSLVDSSGNITKRSLSITLPETISSTPIITGWKLVNERGMIVTIPEGTEHFIQGKISSTSPIALTGKDRAIISAAASPVGVSFKLDKCSGFLSEFQEFTPPLPASCPSASELIKSLSTSVGSGECGTYIKKLPSCRIGQGGGYESLPLNCRSIVASNINQNSCVSRFKNDADFSIPEWRIFLDQKWFLSAEHDTISLYDKDNIFIDKIVW
jgi:hypothetical protein